MLLILSKILLGVLLYAASAFLLALEIFLPSLGLLTALAIGSFAGGTYVFFQIGPSAGWWGLASSAAIIPLCWVCFYKIFPNTSVGRAMILKSSPRAKGDALPQQDQMAALVGQRGVAVSPLRPVGVCQIAGLRVVCQSEMGYIAQHTPIEAVRAQGQSLIVRAIDRKNDLLKGVDHV